MDIKYSNPPSTSTYGLAASQSIGGEQQTEQSPGNTLGAGRATGTSYKPKKLFYPIDLAATENFGYIYFAAAKEYKFMRKEVVGSTADDINEIQSEIFLPLPNNLATAYKAAYEASGIGGFGVAAGNFMSENSLSDIASQITNFGSQDVNSDTVRNIIKGGGLNLGAQVTKGLAAGGGAAGALVGAVFKGLAGGIGGSVVGQTFKGGIAGAGVAVNPFLAQIFQGVDLRTHSFQYELVAKNEKESEMINDIINVFKYHMLPGYRKTNHFFSYPEQFDITIKFPGPRGLDFNFDIGASVLTEFDVDYHGKGGAYYFESGAPMSVIIKLTFQESTITTKEDVLFPGSDNLGNQNGRAVR